ncbi:MAG: pyruvate:ferredoxin (flavodoxin) oxidoreductase [Umezawaea sp.]
MRGTIDGNEAAVDVAYRLNELCAIYPITPSSTMAELADEWASARRTNVWGGVPTVIEMQSEGGAAGAMHGALQGGALSTTYTASQGLLLMIPNMYKIAGELTPTVFHVAARSLAAQGLSIFGDHSDVMAVRQTGFALLSSASVQEAHDFALVAQAATLRSRVPFVHFFDGFRTSHEINTMERLDDDVLRALVPEELVREHRARALTPEHPFIRGTAQNPDVYFQARETVNPYYARIGGIVQEAMDALAERTGRGYRLVEYAGHPEATRIVVIMGSGGVAARETVTHLGAKERVGVLQVRLYRPFPAAELVAALPPTVEAVAVLDRTKEPGSQGEPLFLDVLTSLSEAHARGDLTRMPRVIGGRYGLSSKEFTPGMVAGIFAELATESPRPRFTIGISDDVGGTSLSYDPDLDVEDPATLRAVFYGIGSDGTVGANKNTVKILAEDPRVHAQAYFVYDSKKSGGLTISHLRFGPHPIAAPWLVTKAGFVGIHDFTMLDKVDVLSTARDGATLLLNVPRPPDHVWDALPGPVQREIVDRRLRLFAIDADAVARAAGLPGRTNTILQACFFAISGVLPQAEALERVKATIRKTYGRRGREVVRRNEVAVDSAVASLAQIPVPASGGSGHALPPVVPASAPEFVRTVTAEMMAGRGDALPVSALPVDGTFPSGTTAYEKRRISDLVAEWDPDTCIQCGNCSFVCPHSVIRSKYVDASALDGAPEGFTTAPLNAVGLPEAEYRLQVYVEDCTGCGLCVESCPVSPAGDPTRKAINLAPLDAQLPSQSQNVEFFEALPVNERARVDFGTVRGTQFLQPLFEFPGACAGCGETPYIKLLTQLFGERATVANATGCSSIYGGNLPTTPWTKNAAGRGPAWANSLFEDNAEFGLGLRLAADLHTKLARERLGELRDAVGTELADAILDARQVRESELHAQQERVAELTRRLAGLTGPVVDDLRSVADHLLRRSLWIVGGDGWAYDIGSGGLDHVLATGRDVNVLVLDTEVYSNTGGQSSKSTPLAAVAKFAAAGKTVAKKDLALQAMAYGNVYVARVAMGADPHQTLTAFREAEAYDGPSLIIAYSHCIAHGYDMRKGLDQQYKAVASGHWPLVRYDPTVRAQGGNPFQLDSPRPRIPLADYVYNELRYKVLRNSDPVEAERLLVLAQAAVDQRWQTYEEMATRGAQRFPTDARARGADTGVPASSARTTFDAEPQGVRPVTAADPAEGAAQ